MATRQGTRGVTAREELARVWDACRNEDKGGDLTTYMYENLGEGSTIQEETQRGGERILGNQMRIMKEDAIARTQLGMTMANENFSDTQAYGAFSRLGEGTTWRWYKY